VTAAKVCRLGLAAEVVARWDREDLDALRRWGQQVYRPYVEQRLALIEQKAFGAARRTKVPRAWKAWQRFIERRLAAVENRLARHDLVELDLDAAADRATRPDIARRIVDLLFSTSPDAT
jgi:hypothetical protein